jgi:diguanylate cyclase (GGDEF)-like protein/PAS domain S-box-containing protein
VSPDSRHFRHAIVEAAAFLDTACPPRWTGRLPLPGRRRAIDILIFEVKDELIALPARCPHEGHDLSRCPLLGGSTLVCPVHGRRIELAIAGFPVMKHDGGFLIPLTETGSPAIRDLRAGEAAGPGDAVAIERLREENGKLRLANLKLERQILTVTRSMDAMLGESEQQKLKLKELAGRQQALGRFVERMLDTLVDLLIVVDTEGRIRRLNKAVERELGFSEAELMDTAIDDLLAPGEQQHLAALLPPLPWPVRSVLLETTRLTGRYSGEHGLLAKRRDGQSPIFWLQSALMHTEQGKLEGGVFTASNITEFKNRETRLLLSAKVFESSSEAIFITDPQGTILEVNTAFCTITGYERAEVIGRNTRILKSGMHDRAFYAGLWQELSSRGHWKGEVWDRRKNGEIYPTLLSINAVHDLRGRLSHYVAVSADISYQKQVERELERLAYYDTLTGLPNRVLFENRFEYERLKAQLEGTRFAVLFIDLDHFKNINDMFGHWAGDCLLQEIAGRIQGCLRKTDTIARLGGDEFTVILPGLGNASEAGEIARKLIDAVAKPVRVDDCLVYVGASVGIAVFPDDGQDFTTLTKHADAAMYASKAQGRGMFRYFEARMNEATRRRVVLEAELHQAIEREEFVLYYQPKADYTLNRITGTEALIRWRHPGGNLLPPNLFIPMAEETGLIVPLGKWILRTACLQAHRWARPLPGFRIAVNLSPKQLLADDFIDTLDAILAETGTAPEWVELEITESLVMHDLKKAVECLRRVRERGIHIAMDDFGTGYSSLSYLQKLPVHTLKIDHSFIRAYDSESASEPAAMIKTIVTLGQILNLKVVAEGVETEQQLSLLRAYGCHEIQGDYLSPPVPADEFQRRWIEQHRE